ncbi:MAG: hypothetical protein LUQ06_01455 [Methylococcaceae bacterium]|nr:hypothetical protein [Methylococcaceae bacterium]
MNLSTNNSENKMKTYITRCLKILFLATFLIIIGCSGTIKNMREIPDENLVIIPEQGKSVVIFMRPESLGYQIQSSVFEIKGKLPALVGIIAAETKLAYRLDPGPHLFMVVGESADFMTADLAPNKIYYALIEPRMGVWKARFSFDPIHEEKVTTSDLTDWMEDCRWVEKTAESLDWAQENMPSIQAKLDKYYPVWLQKEQSKKQHLFPIDGK